MSVPRILVLALCLPCVALSIRLNLQWTDLSCSKLVDRTASPHDCLSITAWPPSSQSNTRQIIRYCLDQCSSKELEQIGEHQARFTFAQLAEQKISSRQLYLWSAPIDLVERYQSYLNQPSASLTTSSKDTDFFYNCTWPQFGSFCEYSFDFDQSDESFSSLSELIHDFYANHEYEPTTLTCYEHLRCNRGPSPSCLDWSEICDGRIHCIDGGEDEEHCWLLELNECEENERRCINGQCIPKSIQTADEYSWDCLHLLNNALLVSAHFIECLSSSPTFACEDVVCSTFQPHDSPLLTSSCAAGRNHLLTKALFSVQPLNTSDQCWSALKCLVQWPVFLDDECNDLCVEGQYETIVENHCPDGLLFVPSAPVLFGHVYFAYEKSYFEYDEIRPEYQPQYICYNDQLCSGSTRNLTCHRPKDIPIEFNILGIAPWYDKYILAVHFRFWSCSSPHQQCQSDGLYRCQNSTKCISRHRLLDRFNDCFQADDEQLSSVRRFITVESNKDFFHCPATSTYIAAHLVGNGYCDCADDGSDFCEDEYSLVRSSRVYLSFPLICDGFTELRPVTIDGQLFTDESECESWSCNNIYTHCDHYWNCHDGGDEIDCDPLSVTRCLPTERYCVQPTTNQMECVSVEKMNDGHIDCLGASDEVNLCRADEEWRKFDLFHCITDTSVGENCLVFGEICDGENDCLHGDDEQFCPKINGTLINRYPCSEDPLEMPITEVERFLCHRFFVGSKSSIRYFTVNAGLDETKKIDPSTSSIRREHREPSERCHRGLPLKVGLDQRKVCFCPPSFYGAQCEYQNQRVSLSVQFRALSDSWKTLFAVVARLMDESDQRQVHSSEQFTYLPMRDCQMKFHIYLLYSTRPKNTSLNYSIQIDLYEKDTLTYRTSWLIPVRFDFLPVHRLSTQLDIPRMGNEKSLLCFDLTCDHGRCLRYANTPQSFCQCREGWSGRFCHLPSTCLCSEDARCLGEDTHEQSICLCPKDRFGRRCLIKNDVCDETNSSSKCLHGGECLSKDEDVATKQDWTCLCPKGFVGDRCERKERELLFTFDQNIDLPSSMLVHFVRAHRDRVHDIDTTFKLISLHDDPNRVYWSTPFDLVFIELLQQRYYLAVSERSSSDPIEKKVTLADRCHSINEIFNETIAQLHLLRRIKLYHLPCQRPSTPLLSCFFDESHLCLCQTFQGQRVANCMEFDHDKKRDCLGQNGCENGAQCFQDDSICPQTSICVCPACFYGTRCQFSMSGFSLSLDAILSDHIRPNAALRRQTPLIKITLGITIVMLLIGWINGILALITFKNKAVREVGCGYYLFGSSLTTLMTMSTFSLKFFFLLAIQMGSMTHRTFLSLQCVSMDFLVRVGLNMDQWLNACVALERAMTIIEGARFNKAKSRQKAKYTIPALLIFVMVSTVYDPIYRRLLEDQSSDEKTRIWCIVSYPYWLRILDAVINMAHFIVPFVINLVSATIIIWKSARQRSTVRRNFAFQRLLGEQFRHHRHLLTTPLLIIIFGFPRLVISVVSGCMESSRSSWLYLLGYLVSFVCPMLTFVLFVLPSKIYRREFNESMRVYRRNLPARIVSFRHLWAFRQ